MAGLYLHIPFCKQACNYCDFHFSTSNKNREELLASLLKEIEIRKDYLSGETLDTIYFGGGTPSILSIDSLKRIFDRIYSFYPVNKEAEITLEANPDDLTASYIRNLKNTPVNRLSIGIQSFRDEDLKSMNRAHDSKQALRCVPEAADIGFENMTIDLIYGIPGLGMLGWKANVERALSLPVNHLSCYCLTVEPKTVLAWQVEKGFTPAVNDDEAVAQYEWLIEKTEYAGIPWYEVSNFAKPGWESKHNTSYWKGIPYIGIGPSAHSFNGTSRSWNIRNNALYIQSLEKGIVPSESELLTPEQQFNETVLTSLRTRKGLTAASIRNKYGENAWKDLIKQAEPEIEKGTMILNDETISLSIKGLLFADAIAAEFFKV